MVAFATIATTNFEPCHTVATSQNGESALYYGENSCEVLHGLLMGPQEKN